MIDDELKKKIVNTIKAYEIKYDALHKQIDTFKNVITQLMQISSGINYEMDAQLTQFQKQLDEQFDYEALEKKSLLVVENLNRLKNRKLEKAHKILGLIKKSTESIARLANKSQDKRALNKLQQMLNQELEHDAILVNFNEVLSQCISSAIKDLEELQTTKSKTNQEPCQAVINVKINESMMKLLNNLPISKELDSKTIEIKAILDQELSSDAMSTLIDSLTDLVIESFNLDQNRIKTFLQRLTDQLQNVDEFFKSTSEQNNKSSRETMQLEHGIQDNIKQMKNHLDSATAIEELADKMSQNFNNIVERVQAYRESETKRKDNLEKEIASLQIKLAESERNAGEIQNLLLFQKHKINHDSLTSLPNRYSFEEHIAEAFARWSRSGKEMALAFCDIDHFKKINDKFGHLAGDKTLKKIAELLRSSLRATDFVARVGGEEFVIIFEETSSKTAENILEKIRKIIEECKFHYRENRVVVTVSFGLTTILQSDNIDSLYMRADNAMYEAKKSGRNRVISL